MSRLSLFILPLIAALGIYFLILITLPSLNQVVALLIAIVVGWTLRLLLARLESLLADRSLER
jgi:divalent metal cation (Fe/Co/Zn/Cd) transporter